MNALTLTVEQASTQVDQLAAFAGVEVDGGRVRLPDALGTGSVTGHAFPGGLHLYLYDLALRQPVGLRTVNRPESDVFVLNFSVGGGPLRKSVGDADVTLDRDGPSGVLVYSPGVDTSAMLPVGVPLVFAIVTLTRAALDAYTTPGDPLSTLCASPNRFSLHRDLRPATERALADLIDAGARVGTMDLHARTLALVSTVLAGLPQRDGADRYARLHPDDVTALYAVRESLRTSTGGPPPRLADIAADAGLSASKLKRAFKHLFGTSVYQYHLGVRLDRARRLLESAPFTVAEVSERVGYSTPSHFSRAYRARFGISPLESARSRGVDGRGRPAT